MKRDPLEYIRDTYKVMAYKGLPVKTTEGELGNIIGASGPHVKVMFEKRTGVYHPRDLVYPEFQEDKPGELRFVVFGTDERNPDIIAFVVAKSKSQAREIYGKHEDLPAELVNDLRFEDVTNVETVKVTT